MRKISKFICVLLMAIMMFSLAVIPGTASANGEPALPTEIPKNAIVILHTNDVHGALEGYAKLAALKKAYQDAGAYVLLLDGGDFSQGGAAVNMFKGETAIEIMNMVGYDAAALGNHEFDYGFAVLPPLIAKANFPVLAANVFYENALPFGDRTTFTTPSGFKIGVFGINTPQSKTQSTPTNTIGVDILARENMFNCAREQIAALKADNCDYIICLAHMGIKDDAVGNRSSDMLKEVSGIDLLIDGHSHSTLEEIIKHAGGAANINGTVVTSTGENLKNIGIVTISGGKTEAITVPSSQITMYDQAILTRVNEINAQVKAVYDVVIGSSEVDMTVKNKGSTEIALGDMIADALFWKATQMDFKPDAAIMNAGGIRVAINKGDLTKMNINNVLSLGWRMRVVKVTGAQLLEALESGTYSAPLEAGGFAQVSGIKYTLNIGAEYDPGEIYPGGSTFYKPASIRRVTIESVGGKPFDINANYTIATNSHISVGGATYYVFTKAASNTDTTEMLDEILVEYIVEELDGVITEADYGKPQGRITIVNTPDQAFKDVTKDDWFYDEVRYVSEKGLMAGMGEGVFAPLSPLTRAMMAQILYNIENKPAVTAGAPFTDVTASDWYASSVAWAAQNGIVNGVTDTTFGPETNLTREQLAAMLYRYAQYKKMDLSAGSAPLSFKDAENVSAWALDAVKWACGKGILNGKTADTLQPAGTASRAEVASVMARFSQSVGK